MKYKPSRIAVRDRIKQADAARLLECSRQRITHRIEKGTLKYIIVVDAMNHEDKFVSLREVKCLKRKLAAASRKAS